MTKFLLLAFVMVMSIPFALLAESCDDDLDCNSGERCDSALATCVSDAFP